VEQAASATRAALLNGYAANTMTRTEVQLAGATGCTERAPKRPPAAHSLASHRVIASSGNPDITCSISVCDPRGLQERPMPSDMTVLP